MIYFTWRNINFAHDDFEMPYEGFHFSVYVFLLGQIILGYIGMIYFCILAFKLFHFTVSLFDNAQRLPHFLVTNQKAIVTVAGAAYRYFKVKFFVAAIRGMNPNIVINAGCTQVGTRKTIVQRSFGTNGTYANGTFHKNAVAGKQVFKFLQHFGILVQEFFQFLECGVGEVSFKTTYAANVGGKAGAAHFFIYFINQLAV